jgi:hypothetical protein
VPSRRTPINTTPPDLPPEKAYQLLKKQLLTLQQELIGKPYQSVDALEEEWANLTAKFVMRAFGSPSPNLSNFRSAGSRGVYVMQMSDYVDHHRNQSNFEMRTGAYESVLKSCISELEIDLPETDIKSVYEAGEEYEFYRDVKFCLGLASKEIFVVDPYLSTEIFDVYAGAIPRTVSFRLLSANIPPDVTALAHKYATGGNLNLRSSKAIHDRVLFADNRVWVVGQSLKDAAKKKPTYIVEHDEPPMRTAYEPLWNAATVII